ncbi:Ras guanine nucleotide exchange factor [Tieghemostelium lacteum]|uniref:Ras guanine nucleotide exchange factor n=1 Tax=Tieghemostelium lacteum TaxID=361077 RepID=A0A152A2Z1_TIELA|nr:Ras guanine nucleotide exchange factor [Tieghemostelium lacteum]|eukprot:KYR00579.1 Ras guanine nucleotide exchange factor [Tieghemostelium lacteum]
MSTPINISTLSASNNNNSGEFSPSKMSSSPNSKSSLEMGRKTLSKTSVVKSLLKKTNSGTNLLSTSSGGRRTFSSSPSSFSSLHHSQGGEDDDDLSSSRGPDSPKSIKHRESSSELMNSNGSLRNVSPHLNGKSTDNSHDRSLWTIRSLKDHPEIVDIIDRVKPINRGIALAQNYAAEETLLKDDPLIGQDTMLQLILQHLQFEGLISSRKILEEETKVKYNDYPFNESRLLTLLRTAVKDSEKIYSLTLDERQKDAQLLEEHLAFMGLLRDETIETTEDVNIYDEPEDALIIYVEEKEQMQQQQQQQQTGGSTGSLIQSIGGSNLGSSLSGSTNSLGSSINGFGSGPMSPAKHLQEESKIIKAASLNKLVIILTPEKNHDMEFTKTFLLTYQSFTTPEKLLQKLVQRYHVPIEKLSKSGLAEHMIKNQVSVIQLRVVNTLKTWIKDYFSDFNDKLIQSVKSFCETLRHDNNTPLANRISETLNNKIKGTGEDEGEKKTQFKEAPPEPKVPKNIWSQTLDIFDIDEEEIARQLTLIDFEIFSSIKPTELLNQSWNKPKLKHRSPNVLALIGRFNEISQWTASSILSYSRVKDRTRIMTKFVRIAEYSHRALNNFNVSMAILSGLNAASVHRLKFTKDDMPKHTQQTLQDLQNQFSNAMSYRDYRNQLAKANPPCIPYLGVHLTDLTFVEEGNPDLIQGQINFSKRRLVYQSISIIHNLQNTKYNLQPVYQIAKLLRTLKPRFDEDEQYHRSMKFEPRNKERNEIL